MAKEPRKAKAATAPAAFELDEQKAESFRAAAEHDDADALPQFWARVGAEMGFDPDSIILVDVPESGAIKFTATAIDPASQDAAPASDEAAAEEQEEGEAMPAIARLEAIAAESLPEGRALVRFATMFMLDQIKHSPRWSDLLENQQRDLGAQIQENASLLVERIIEAVRANGAQPIRALLESYSEKDGIKATLKIKPNDDQEALQAIIGLHSAQGKHVLITVASTQDFDQSPGEIPVDPDEPGLGFDAGTDRPADDSDLAGETDEEGQAEA